MDLICVGPATSNVFQLLTGKMQVRGRYKSYNPKGSGLIIVILYLINDNDSAKCFVWLITTSDAVSALFFKLNCLYIHTHIKHF